MARVFITALSVVVTLTITPVDCTGAPQSAQSATPKTASVARRAKPPAPSAMSNQDVVTLVGAGLAEDIIITNIRQSPSRAFDLSAEALVALKRNGVSDNIIRVMLDPDATVPASAPPPPAAATTAEAPSPAAVPDALLPSEVGVYLRAAGKLTDIEPEIVNWKTGGILKTMATVGFKGPHVNGWVRNSTSRLELPTDAEVVVMTPEGTSIAEYQLLHLYKKGDRREFRAATTGMFGMNAKSGAERNAVEFSHEKVAPRTYVVRTGPLAPGEYGFLPPGVTSASLASAGKLYTFAVR